MSLNELERSEKLQVRIKIRGEVKAAWKKKKKKGICWRKGRKDEWGTIPAILPTSEALLLHSSRALGAVSHAASVL